MAKRFATVRLEFANPKAVRAMKVLIRELASIADDLSWRDDVKRACRAARYALNNMQLRQVKK